MLVDELSGKDGGEKEEEEEGEQGQVPPAQKDEDQGGGVQGHHSLLYGGLPDCKSVLGIRDILVRIRIRTSD